MAHGTEGDAVTKTPLPCVTRRVKRPRLSQRDRIRGLEDMVYHVTAIGPSSKVRTKRIP
jgi:hypothetical protein